MPVWEAFNQFITLWTNSADDNLMIFFLFFPESRIWHFMQTVFIGDNLHEMSKTGSEKSKKKKSILIVVFWIFYPES